MTNKIYGIWNKEGISNQQWVEEIINKIKIDFNNVTAEAVDSDHAMNNRYGIERYPAFLAIKNDALLDKKIGKFMNNDIDTWLRNYGWS